MAIKGNEPFMHTLVWMNAKITVMNEIKQNECILCDSKKKSEVTQWFLWREAMEAQSEGITEEYEGSVCVHCLDFSDFNGYNILIYIIHIWWVYSIL